MDFVRLGFNLFQFLIGAGGLFVAAVGSEMGAVFGLAILAVSLLILVGAIQILRDAKGGRGLLLTAWSILSFFHLTILIFSLVEIFQNETSWSSAAGNYILAFLAVSISALFTNYKMN